MRATLIFPGITSCGWGCFGKVNNSEANFIPHGLAYIAAYAKASGHSIDVIDMRSLSGWDDFTKGIKERSPGIFGISSMSVDFGTALEAIRIIKEVNDKSIIILGGVHATVAFDDVKDDNRLDYIIKGEGEISFADLLGKLEKGERPDRIISGVMPDINMLPYPDRDILRFTDGELKFPWLLHMPAPFVSIIASRGCPHQCSFCQPAERAIFGGKARIRSVENVIDELKFLRDRYHFKSLLVHDDFFAFNPNWIRRFCDAYKENGFNQTFTCQVRSDFIVKNEEIVSRMVDCGLSCFMIGFESGSQRILDFIKKGTTVEMNKQAVDICRKYGIKIFANYMFGLPTETEKEVFDTIDFIRWAKPDYPSPAFFTPHPGTELYEYCNNLDLSLVKSYRSYARNPNEPKIKGVDYHFLNFAVHRSTEYRIDEQLKHIEKNYQGNNAMEVQKTQLKDMKNKIEELHSFYRNKYLNISDNHESIAASKKTMQTKERVLVTGGTGFIGSALVQRLIDAGYPVAVLTRDKNHSKAVRLAAKGVEVYEGCVEDMKALEQVRGVDIIYHLAVFPGTEGRDMFEVNVNGTENILKTALKNNVKKFIYASSIEAQGTTSDITNPLDEDMECKPVSNYGLSKRKGEEVVLRYIERDGLNGTIARIGNVYGIGGLSFIHSMSMAVIERNVLLNALPVMGRRVVQPIYIDDLVSALVACVEHKKSMNGIVNFTGHQPVTVGEWFREIGILLGLERNIAEASEKSIDICNVAALRKAHPQVNYFLSGDEPAIHRLYTDNKLVAEIGDYQEFSLSKGLAYTLEWYYNAGVFNGYC